MSDQSEGELEANNEHPFERKRLYDFGAVKLVPKNLLLKAKTRVISSDKKGSSSILIGNLLYDGNKKEIQLHNYGNGTIGKKEIVKIGDVDFTIAWGSKLIELPFKIKLNDFELERYAGSMSPSSYSSKVTLIDEKESVNMPFHIYMNHILDYKSHRFFQSSYDLDEKGTILSINNDPGKLPTYLGYLLLTIGFILNILNPKSRFRKLASAVQKDTIMRNSIIFLSIIFTLNTPLHSQSINKNHASKFGDLLIQTQDGRIKSLDTFSNEVLLKLAKKSSLQDQDSNQIMLGMITDPRSWQEKKMILIKHSKISNILGLGKKSKTYASFSDFFDYSKKTPYKLTKYIEESTHKSPIQRNEFDRQVIKTDERLNIAYMIYTGDLMNIVPKPKDINNKWYAVKDAISSFEPTDSKMIRNLFINYFSEIDNAKKSNNWTKADEALTYIKKFQRAIGKDIIPDQSKIDAEKFFKRISLFNKLILVYLFAGVVLLGIIMTKMLKPNANITKISKIVLIVITFAFILHTLGLAARWYIGGHAPWSNAYEAMLYVAWSMALAGLVFARYSLIAPALTGIITGITLGATFLTEMDPQITNLVPVLKSYWLNIHVSVITASYGFLGLSMILGFFTLILFIFKNEKRSDLNRSIIEATRINEMTAILGISMLTVGNFLGGVWANESWGRYWGWDPKETWAWISILAYVIVLHIRFIPAIKKNYDYWYSVASTTAYGVIIMTFVGVNYYLSGMHSYAAGDPVPIPKYLYLIIAIVLAVIALAYPKRSLKK
jgi:cytochrome c-type biogenesis protein CcsB